MGGLTSAVYWWEEWQLRVLVLTSLAIQFLLFIFSFLRRYYIPGWSRFIMWLAYLAGDAVAIYALATLFNRHKAAAGEFMLEEVWAPILLIHLGGHDGITAYGIEDNELWSRHLLTAVSQVTVAIYVFCKFWWWPAPAAGSYDKWLLQAAILLFIPGIIKCFVKPWALKSASIYSLVSTPAAEQNEGEMYGLEKYVERAKNLLVQGASGSGSGSMEDGFGRRRPRRKVMDQFSGELRRRLRPNVMEPPGTPQATREMVQGRSETAKLFVDLSSSYPRRLSILEQFCGLTKKTAYGSVRQGLATAFLLLYTKLKTAADVNNLDYPDMEDDEKSLQHIVRALVLLSRTFLPWASVALFHHSNREAYNAIDVIVTYAMICSTAVLETYSTFSLVHMGEAGEEWPEMVAQYSFIGYFARNMKHSKKMWVVSLLRCKDFLDQLWCMKPCFSSAGISELVLGYLKDGWRNKIENAASYRRFNDHRSSEGLSLSLSLSRNRNRPLLFDESVLLWHIATEFCFLSTSSSLPEHRCAFAEVPTWTERLQKSLASHWLLGKIPFIFHGIAEKIREMACILRTASSRVRNDQTTSPCIQEQPTACKAVLCTQMSNYMAYLLFVNPEMLLPGSRRNLFTAAQQELQAIFKGDNQAPLPVGNKRELTDRIISKLNSSSSSEATTFIHEAWMLAQKLQSLGDEKKMWEVIQCAWVEMLCFSASRCRGYLHAKALGKGGEFLSYVWLLLFHMGMETFTDKLQMEDLPSQQAGNNAVTAPPSTSSTTGAGDPSTSSDVHTASAGAGAAPSALEICIIHG